MIGTLFALSGLLLFSLAVAVMDGLRALARLIEDTERCFGHDVKIYPDNLDEL